MINLPSAYAERMEKMLGAEYNDYLKSLEEPYKSGIRLNGLKIDTDTFKELTNFSISPIPFIKGGYYVGGEDTPSKHPYYYAGLYYIQEPSAMTPAFLFDVKPGDRVLDVCAAPGGKSTALAAKLKGQGVLVSNDVSNSRAKALLKNIELFGVRNAVVLSEPTSKLAERFYGYFDKILVDAPCSGEGMFRKQPAIMKNWEQYGTGYYAKLQREILPDAIKMLKPGGMLLYSTCTFSPEEDEETVSFVLNEFPNMKLHSLASDEEMAYYDSCGFMHGRNDLLGTPVSGIEKTVRLFPHKVGGEGHFVAVFKKDEEPYEPSVPLGNIKKAKLPEELVEFLSHIKFDIDKSCIEERDSRFYLVSKDIPNITGLRILRNGLLLGEEKKGRFEPSQALACALLSSDYDNVYDMKADNPDVIKYLKCESIDVPDSVKDGYVLICVDGYSLGFGKVKKGNFKNKYLPGWRLM